MFHTLHPALSMLRSTSTSVIASEFCVSVSMMSGSLPDCAADTVGGVISVLALVPASTSQADGTPLLMCLTRQKYSLWFTAPVRAYVAVPAATTATSAHVPVSGSLSQNSVSAVASPFVHEPV